MAKNTYGLEEDRSYDLELSNVYRINALLVEWNQSWYKQELNGLMKCNEILYTELYPYIYKKKKKDMSKYVEEHDEMKESIREKFRTYKLAIKNRMVYAHKQNISDVPEPQELLDEIYEWKLLIVRDMERVGLLTKADKEIFHIG